MIVFLVAILGASACVKLNLFEEAFTWCDEGLAVSLDLLKLKCDNFHFIQSTKTLHKNVAE